MEATLVPLATLHMLALAFPSAHYICPRSNVPGLGEVVRAFPRAQRHFGSPPQRWIGDGRRRARCGYGIGGACLAQPAAVLCCLLEFADSVLCHRGSVSWHPSTPAMLLPDEPLDSSPETFDPERAGTSIVSMLRVAVRTGADMFRSSTAFTHPRTPRLCCVFDCSSAVSCLQRAKTASKRRAWPRSTLCGHCVAESAAAVRTAFPRVLGSGRQLARVGEGNNDAWAPSRGSWCAGSRITQADCRRCRKVQALPVSSPLDASSRSHCPLTE